MPLLKSALVSRNIVQALRLRGGIDIVALRKGMEQLTERYAPPSGIVPRLWDDDLPVHDFSSVPEDDRELELQRYIHKQSVRSLGRTGEPLLRTALARLSSTESILVIILARSLTTQGINVRNITVELSVLYNRLVTGHSPALPLSVGTRPDSLVETGLAPDNSLIPPRQETDHLFGALELPLDHPRSSHSNGTFGRETLTVGQILLASAREVSTAEGVTPFTTFLAAFTVLLSRHSGQKNFCVGVSPANLRGGKDHVGAGSSALQPLYADLSRNPSFRELLQAIRQSSAKTIEQAPIPADHNVIPIDALPVKADRGVLDAPFQVAFLWEQPSWDAVHFLGLTLSAFKVETRPTGLDLVLHLEDGPSGLVMTADYDAALFDADTIQRLLAHYQILLAEAVSHPEVGVSRLAILTDTERELLLHQWNSTTQEYPGDVPLQQLIEAQVARTPNSIAVEFQEQRLTYAELNARANQLAAHLRSLGVTRNTLVGVCLERSIDLLVAPLAILKAGGAYLPLDPEHPDDRIGPIVENARLEILIGRRELGARLPSFRGKLVLLDWDTYQQYPQTNLPVPGSGGDLAYVIYTSGSTGQPKGVMVPRRALNNLLCSVREWFQLGAHDVLLALTTIAFDIAGVDLWLPLLAGARILMVDRDTTLDSRLLQDTIARNGITFLQCTPSSWKLLMDSGWQGKLNLQAVCTGEAMPKDLARKLFPKVACLWNMYGPTETTIWSTGYKFAEASDPILIGRPLANTRTYILDEHMAPTPIGVAGELYIAGDGLASGYWNNPALTATRFVADPFSPGPDTRLYRTGDLARYRSNGQIECLGRNDDQIKLRGFRIEPEEIRSAITRHPSIQDAVAVLETGATGDSRIVAYLISDATNPPEAAELRVFLRRSLPDYMIPATFQFLERFPLNSNGKIDRRALTQSRFLAPEIPRKGAPTDEVESRLRNIFRSVLGLNDMGIDDDFFDLGGHSLTAAQLFREINLCFNLDLPLATLFHAPTVRGVAALIRDSGVERMSEPVVEIQGKGSRTPIYCVGAMDGELIVFRRLAMELGQDQPLYGLQPFRLLHPLITVNELATAYIDELRKKGETRPCFLLGYSFGGLVAVEIARQLECAGIAPPVVMLIDTAYPAGCLTGESWPHRVRRYRYNWNQVAGAKGLSHVVDRVKHRFARMARTASFAVGVPLPHSLNDVYNVQGRAEESYRIKSHKGRVYLFRAESQPEFFHGGLSLGWSGALSDLVVEEVPGDHGTIHSGNNLKIMARKLQECLQRPIPTGRAAARA